MNVVPRIPGLAALEEEPEVPGQGVDALKRVDGMNEASLPLGRDKCWRAGPKSAPSCNAAGSCINSVSFPDFLAVSRILGCGGARLSMLTFWINQIDCSI